jgi:hypothetical protein
MLTPGLGEALSAQSNSSMLPAQGFYFFLGGLLNANTGNIQEDNLEFLENYQRLISFYEVQEVKQSYENAHEKASRAVSSSIPSSWILSGQNPPCQSPKDITTDQLYAQAERAKNPFFNLIQALENLVNAEQRQKTALDLKGRARAIDKIERDYGGDASRLIDIVRGSIICRGFDEMNSIISFLRESKTQHSYTAFIVRIKSGFADPTAEKTYGYRDVKVGLISCCEY